MHIRIWSILDLLCGNIILVSIYNSKSNSTLMYGLILGYTWRFDIFLCTFTAWRGALQSWSSAFDVQISFKCCYLLCSWVSIFFIAIHIFLFQKNPKGMALWNEKVFSESLTLHILVIKCYDNIHIVICSWYITANNT